MSEMTSNLPAMGKATTIMDPIDSMAISISTMNEKIRNLSFLVGELASKQDSSNNNIKLFVESVSGALEGFRDSTTHQFNEVKEILYSMKDMPAHKLPKQKSLGDEVASKVLKRMSVEVSRHDEQTGLNSSALKEKRTHSSDGNVRTGLRGEECSESSKNAEEAPKERSRSKKERERGHTRSRELEDGFHDNRRESKDNMINNLSSVTFSQVNEKKVSFKDPKIINTAYNDCRSVFKNFAYPCVYALVKSMILNGKTNRSSVSEYSFMGVSTIINAFVTNGVLKDKESKKPRLTVFPSLTYPSGSKDSMVSKKLIMDYARLTNATEKNGMMGVKYSEVKELLLEAPETANQVNKFYIRLSSLFAVLYARCKVAIANDADINKKDLEVIRQLSIFFSCFASDNLYGSSDYNLIHHKSLDIEIITDIKKDFNFSLVPRKENVSDRVEQVMTNFVDFAKGDINEQLVYDIILRKKMKNPERNGKGK